MEWPQGTTVQCGLFGKLQRLFAAEAATGLSDCLNNQSFKILAQTSQNFLEWPQGTRVHCGLFGKLQRLFAAGGHYRIARLSQYLVF